MDTDRIITGDCIEVLAGLPEGAADLVFADSPFNIGLDYPGYDDRQPHLAYLDMLRSRLHPGVSHPDAGWFLLRGHLSRAIGSGVFCADDRHFG